MDFPGSLDYLGELAALGVKVGLEHTRHLARRMGDPQAAYPSIIVGGTNGKGSTSSFLARALKSAGYRVGLYTSPHLVDVRERIRVDGEMIGEWDFASEMTRVREEALAALAAGELALPPTYFEALTLLAFLHFRQAGVDAAVLEVGLGGRLDCTNVAEPLVSIVTNISQDHEDYLGVGLENIAREKAGIFRTGVPVFTAAKEGVPLATLCKIAEATGTPLHPAAQCAVRVGPDSWRLSCEDRAIELPLPALPGRHQIANAALAVRACWALGDMGWKISADAIREGIGTARWPGRLEQVGTAPDLYLDGAHNPEGCEALAEFVKGLPHGRRALVFAAMRDKPVAAMLRPLLPLVGALWATSVPMPRCMSPEDLAAHAGDGVRQAASPVDALREAMEWAGPDGVVIAAGSLYLVGFLKSCQSGVLSRSWGSGL